MNKAPHLPRISVTPVKGVRSNMTTPGYERDSSMQSFEIGIWNTFAVFHFPESGTLNFCSSQIAVLSFSWLSNNHAHQLLGTGPLVDFKKSLSTPKNDPRAHRRAWSS